MSIATSAEPKIREVSVSEDMITARLADGRAISVPLSWSWRLSDATPEQRIRILRFWAAARESVGLI